MKLRTRRARATAGSCGSIEWVCHKTADGEPPNGVELVLHQAEIDAVGGLAAKAPSAMQVTFIAAFGLALLRSGRRTNPNLPAVDR